MSISRRIIIGLAAGTAAIAMTSSAIAQEWKAKYPELVYAVVPAENASGVTERMGPWMAYLSKELGVKVVHSNWRSPCTAVAVNGRPGLGR